ncbi:DUF6475 domain-containing protein [Pandoraea communis]|uniref:DUF6475 domain-containing protein n=1 Tax=Pandoraea communis TaxID=2508297 RepID=UPI0025A58FC6|nr:DUF6475 domain-containing protein [Pandoraea communis]MDM8356657.1 DUF6475 domain-containing protein [Pandoraea communis]
MKPTDSTEFFALISNVYAFYRQDYSEFVGQVWWGEMQVFDLAAVRDALGRHAANPDAGQFLPKPADVVKMLQGSTQDSALLAWHKVDKAIREVGTYASVAFDDALIHRVVFEMGGWVSLGTKDESEWPFVKNEFVNRYRGYRGRSQVPEYPPLLIGIAETTNTRAGFQSQGPVLIGNAELAAAVQVGGTNTPLVGYTRLTGADLPQLPRKAEPARLVA